MNVTSIDHVGLAVESIEEAAKLFIDALGGEFVCGGDDERLDIRTVQIRLGGFKIELMEPLSDDSYLRAYLDKRGQGFHHLTVFVDDVPESARELEGAGYETVDTDLSNPAWRETYVRPRSGFGTLLQITDTDMDWDAPSEGVTLESVLAGDVLTGERGYALRPEVAES